MATTSPFASTRFIEMDALRGFAVMGILAMNIMAFAMPQMAYMSPAVYGGTDRPDLLAWALSFIFVDSKMRGLFSLLFGASMMLVIMRADAKGESAGRVHYSRMFWLALFGLFHFFFIWWGDILFLYAFVGSIAFLFRNMQPRTLVIVAIVIFTLGFLLFTAGMGSIFFLQAAANAPGATAEAVQAYQEAVASFNAGPEAVAKELAVYGGSYGDIFSHKLDEQWYLPLVNSAMMIFETLPLMLIGMALCKNGFLLGQADGSRYRKSAFWGIAIGVVAYATLAYLIYTSGFDILVVMNAMMAWSMPPRLIMTLGYAAGLILLIKRFADSGLMARVVATGRAAFTNYLGTSVLMTTVFYGYGLSLFGEVGRAELYLFVIGAWAIMLLWSKPWLDRYRYGPLEWLWRSLSRMSMQPMRKTPIANH